MHYASLGKAPPSTLETSRSSDTDRLGFVSTCVDERLISLYVFEPSLFTEVVMDWFQHFFGVLEQSGLAAPLRALHSPRFAPPMCEKIPDNIRRCVRA